MPDTAKRAAEIDQAVKEADERKADATAGIAAILKAVETMSTSISSVSARLDAIEAASKKADDTEDDKEDDAMPAALADSQPGARVRADAAEKERAAGLTTAQVRADGTASAFGMRAPPPLTGEAIDAYRRRLLQPYLHHSRDFKAVDLAACSGSVLDGIEARVYADAKAASANPDVAEGHLLERQTTDAAGRQIRTFYGAPKTWMSQFAQPAQRLTGINTRF